MTLMPCISFSQYSLSPLVVYSWWSALGFPPSPSTPLSLLSPNLPPHLSKILLICLSASIDFPVMYGIPRPSHHGQQLSRDFSTLAPLHFLIFLHLSRFMTSCLATLFQPSSYNTLYGGLEPFSLPRHPSICILAPNTQCLVTLLGWSRRSNLAPIWLELSHAFPFHDSLSAPARDLDFRLLSALLVSRPM